LAVSSSTEQSIKNITTIPVCHYQLTVANIRVKYWLIDWLVFNANISSISAISWREQILYYIRYLHDH